MATVEESSEKSEKYLSGYKSIANKLGINENYLVTITANGNKGLGIPNRAFVGFTDETMSINYSSSWSNSDSETSLIERVGTFIFGQDKIEGIKKSVENIAQNTGISGKTLYSSAKVWNGSSSISLHIPFNFVYFENTKQEVKDQIRDLMMLAAPIDKGIVTLAPGPTLMGTTFDTGVRIQCKIGNAFLLDHCIITDVSSQIDMRFDQSGNPIAAKVDVSIESFFDSATAQMIFAFFENKTWNLANEVLRGKDNISSIMWENESKMREAV